MGLILFGRFAHLPFLSWPHSIIAALPACTFVIDRHLKELVDAVRRTAGNVSTEKGPEETQLDTPFTFRPH